MKKGLYNNAMEDCNTLIKINPNDSGSYYMRGLLYEKMNKLEEGIADFSECLKINPDHYNAAYARGACQNKQGNFLKAIEDYDLALAKDTSPSLFTHKCFGARIQSLLKSQRLLKDSNTCSDFAGLDSNSKTNNNRRNDCDFNSKESSLNRTGSLFSNQEDQRILIENMPCYSSRSKEVNLDQETEKNEAEEYYNMALNAKKIKDFKTAIKYYTKTIELDETHIKAYFNRGFSYDKLGSHLNAIADYNKVIELDPDNGYSYYNLGISLDKANKHEEAIENFTKAISYIPTNADFYYNRGFSYRKSKEYDFAIKDYTKAIALNPTHFKVFTYLI